MVANATKRPQADHRLTEVLVKTLDFVVMLQLVCLVMQTFSNISFCTIDTTWCWQEEMLHILMPGSQILDKGFNLCENALQGTSRQNNDTRDIREDYNHKDVDEDGTKLFEIVFYLNWDRKQCLWGNTGDSNGSYRRRCLEFCNREACSKIKTTDGTE